MQTKKMSLANLKGKLSRAEMKNITAGSNTFYCNGSVGTWYYFGTPTCATVSHDIALYCRSGSGSPAAGSSCMMT